MYFVLKDRRLRDKLFPESSQQFCANIENYSQSFPQVIEALPSDINWAWLEWLMRD